MILLLGAGGAMGWSWNKANNAGVHVVARGQFFAALKADFLQGFPTAEARKRLREPVEQTMQRLETEFPALSVEFHPVPDEENGYLQMHFLGGGDCPGPGFPGSTEFRAYLMEPGPWNAVEAHRQFSANAALVERVERIAALKQRSSAGMPHDFSGFISARAARCSSTILLMKARLAAENGDEETTLRYVQLAGNLANHFHDVETPNLLGETVRILLDLEIERYAFQHLLPALGRDADLPRWKAVLARYRYSPGDFADVMRGESQTVLRCILLPMILDESKPERPSDAVELAQAYASCFDKAVASLKTVTCTEWAANPVLVEEPDFSGLSRASREILQSLMIGSKAWNKGYMRAMSVLSQHQAALDLMILEKGGIVTQGGPAGGVTRDPIDGQPFVFDMARRTLGVRETEEDRKIEPVRLPW
ncbi:hypothetical protein KBB96_10890 [Luteolibacter ambystomatis]|uniref:Uncharacterized protein n=1 Tax=Luteolibacter ambystomatis TaxID=2824561 RepID=A0A975G4X6_9BACT|nr:hypothetical protein [Luteolibacter ambystomatis]QUE49377.1 hypothetical protein KBB96_10890 [Luteolibacter ambystomatis]